MATTQTSKSAAVRARLNHPVIDSDGHTVEFEPAVLDYLQQIGGPRIVERYKTERRPRSGPAQNSTTSLPNRARALPMPPVGCARHVRQIPRQLPNLVRVDLR